MNTIQSAPEPLPSVGRLAEIAAVWEVSARKPGNVHPGAPFDDACFVDFLLSAAALVQPLDRLAERALPLGAAVLDAIRGTRRVVAHNTNLGIVLLAAPLAAVPESETANPEAFRRALDELLDELGPDDARDVLAAIRLARPAALGEPPRGASPDDDARPRSETDPAPAPRQGLRQLMTLAADRDLVARQYALVYPDVFRVGLRSIESHLPRGEPLERLIQRLFLDLLAEIPDSLIARKRGPREAERVSGLAAAVRDAGWPEAPAGERAWINLDRALRDERHALNPGATADLVAATLLLALRLRRIPLPWPGTWHAPPSLDNDNPAA